MIRILTDSTSDLSDELLEKYNIVQVPLHICLGDEEFRDRVEITPEEIYAWSEKNHTTPKTSAVAFGDAVDAMKPIVRNRDEIICFSISASMSTTNNVFRLAADDLDASEYVSVIDSKNLSTGIGLLVLAAAERAAAGDSREAIVEYINTLIPKVRASFVVDTLTFLQRGGRCSTVAALAGSVLKLHPKIEVVDGAMGVGSKYRGTMDRVILKYVEDLRESMDRAMKDRVFITHSGCAPELVEQVREAVASTGVFAEILETRAGGVISSHCGPGTLGVLYIEK